ncbi:hypothetical protein PVNG_06396 [Plasmodium vivax North Korean]|uniref:Variable surface protein Vir18 n=1 Tax=Plasmodium vivax North Korean TaxID=1035514 RepID=A0A0J9U3D8_PLAVI|nr:hypothetical protein PVNG_06396 [Plasmodium vivax North Korean]
MNRHFGTQHSIFHHWQKYNGGYCFNKYSIITREIEEKINNFYKIQNGNLYQEWDKINKAIKAGNADIQDCVSNGRKLNDLYAVDTIKNFRERCPKPNASTCRGNRASQVIKSPASKKTVSEGSCRASKSCKEGTAQTKGEKGKSQLRAPEGDSKTISTPITDPKLERQNNPIGQEPGNAKIISQPQPRAAHSDSPVVTDIKEREQSDNGDSIHLIEKKLMHKLYQSDQQLQTPTAVESNTGDSSQVRDSDENTPKGKIPLDETFGSNTTGQQSNDVTVFPRKEVYGQTVATNTHGPESAAEGDSLHHNHPNGYRVSASTGDLSSASAELDTRSGNYTDSVTANRESSPVETPCTEASSDQASGSETSCSKREDSELNTSTGDILERFHEFFNKLPNKEHVIKASAPMGIVLLLGLLFKVN